MLFWGLFAYLQGPKCFSFREGNDMFYRNVHSHHISTLKFWTQPPLDCRRKNHRRPKAPDSEEISTLSKTTNPISTTSSNEIGWAQPFFPLPAPHGWFKYHETKRNMRGRFSKWERKCHIFSTKSMETKKNILHKMTQKNVSNRGGSQVLLVTPNLRFFNDICISELAGNCCSRPHSHEA